MRISVIGCGYLGTVHAAVLAHLGHDVVGIDVDPEKVAVLASGHTTFFEPGLAELLAAGTQSGRLRFSTDPAELAGAVVHFVCVGTPQRADSGLADLAAVDAAVAALLPRLGSGDLVVGKSTVPVGTAASVLGRLRAAGSTARVVWNPEFLREGHAVGDTLHPDRLVYGVADDGSDDGAADVALLDEVYADLLRRGVPRVVTDLPTAELAKVAANSFLATKISFANAMAEVCEAAGGDAVALARTMAYDPRIGAQYLGVGLGFGGGCLPKDIRAFAATADELGVGRSVAFLHEVDEINDRCQDRAVELVGRAAGGLRGARVAVLGAAFKPESDDVRSSPALDLAVRIADEGADVVVTDPQALLRAQLVAPQLRYAVDAVEALTGADVVVLATEWQEYRSLDPAAVAAVVRRRCVVDTRNVWDLQQWQAAGFQAAALGRSAVRPGAGAARDAASEGGLAAPGG